MKMKRKEIIFHQTQRAAYMKPSKSYTARASPSTPAPAPALRSSGSSDASSSLMPLRANASRSLSSVEMIFCARVSGGEPRDARALWEEGKAYLELPVDLE